MIDVLTKRTPCKDRDTGKMPCEDEGLDVASTSQGTPKIVSKPREARESQGWIPLQVSEGP